MSKIWGKRGLIIALVIGIIFGIFGFSNRKVLEVDLLFTKVFMSQAIVIFSSAILGAVIVSFLNIVSTFRFKRQIKELNRQIDVLQTEKENQQREIDKKDQQIDLLYKQKDDNGEEILSKE